MGGTGHTFCPPTFPLPRARLPPYRGVMLKHVLRVAALLVVIAIAVVVYLAWPDTAQVPFDRVTGKRMEPITTGQIYYGAIPFGIIQCIMVALVILFPGMVTHYKSSGTKVDPAAVQQQLDNLQGLGAGSGDDAPPIDLGPPKIE